MGEFCNLRPFPRGDGGGGVQDVSKNIVIWPVNYAEKMVISKFRSDNFEKKGRGRESSCPPIFRSVEKGTTAFNFHPNELRPVILGLLSQYDHPRKN